jgi:hypothetical protein
MRFMRLFRCALVSVAAVSAAACGKGPTDAELRPEPNFVELQSDAGDYIGAGRSYRYTQADAIITVQATGGLLRINIRGDEDWYGEFQSPGGLAKVTPGTYSNLQRYPFHAAGAGGMSWTGDGRGCNTLTGSFTVEDVTYAADVLTAIKLRFEQHCESGSAALRGTIHWRSDDTTGPAGPVNPIPTTLWRPGAGSTPTSGNFAYLKSDPGDYIGQGQTYTYTGSGFTVSGGGNHASVNAGDWGGDFRGINSLSELQTGYYPDLGRYPFHNPVKGGLNWSGKGRGCNTLTGWFVVDHVAYSSGRLTALDLRFEQRCEGSASSALRGQIHWRG